MTDNSAYADSSGNYGSGGGIENDGSLAVTNSTFTNNLASGGAYAAPTTGPITEGSAGGAIDSEGPSLSITNSAFANNEAVGPATGTGEGNGGAINISSPASITNSTFNGNEALGRLTNGGAISTGENETFAAPPIAISNCTFTGNEAVGANGANNSTALFGGEALGGAIANASPLTIANSTFTDNMAKGGDGGDNVGGLDPDPVVGEAWAAVLSTSPARSRSPTRASSATRPSAATPPPAPALRPRAAASPRKSLLPDPHQRDLRRQPGDWRQRRQQPPWVPGTGGSGFGGGFYNGVDSNATVTDALFLNNQAVGGSAGTSATGGVGAGGAIANGGGAGAFEVAFPGSRP